MNIPNSNGKSWPGGDRKMFAIFDFINKLSAENYKKEFDKYFEAIYFIHILLSKNLKFFIKTKNELIEKCLVNIGID